MSMLTLSMRCPELVEGSKELAKRWNLDKPHPETRSKRLIGTACFRGCPVMIVRQGTPWTGLSVTKTGLRSEGAGFVAFKQSDL